MRPVTYATACTPLCAHLCGSPIHRNISDTDLCRVCRASAP